MPRNFNPLPGCPNPIKWDVDGRIKELQARIDDPTTSEEQKINLRFAIDLYNEGKFPGAYRYIQGGKVVALDDLDLHHAFWTETLGRPSAHRGAYNPSTADQPSGHEAINP